MMSEMQRDLGLSHALGFWAKHTFAMDELYALYAPDDDSDDEDELPPELRAIWEGEQRQQLDQVFSAAEVDRTRLLNAAKEELANCLGRQGSPFRTEKRGSRDPWRVGMYLHPAKGRKLAKGPIWLTIMLDTGIDLDLVLYTSIWVAGGRAMGRLFEETLISVADGARFQQEDWSSGLALLSRVALSDYLVDGAIDLDRVRLRLREDYARQNNEALAGMLSRLRE